MGHYLLGRGRYVLNGSDLHYLLRIEVFSSAAVDWRSIGIQLGYPTSALDDIDQMIFNREGVRGCFCEMLSIWLTSRPPFSNHRPTIDALADALYSCGYNVIASQIRRNTPRVRTVMLKIYYVSYNKHRCVCVYMHACVRACVHA